MKKIAVFLLFAQLGFAQQTIPIKGKVISEITKSTPIGTIFIQIKGEQDYFTADKNGEFSITPKNHQETYVLIIEAGSHERLEYLYDSKWIKRKSPKHIVVYSNINVSKKLARRNFQEGKLKLFVQGGIAPISNSKGDKKFEKKYKITYIDFGCDLKTEDALLDYNKKAFFLLDQTYGEKWRKKVRTDVIGL